MRRLNSILTFYKKNVNVPYARKVRKKIFDRVKPLKNFPGLGKPEESYKPADAEYRSLIEGHHKIVYRVEESEVIIVEIFDTRQDPEKLEL